MLIGLLVALVGLSYQPEDRCCIAVLYIYMFNIACITLSLLRMTTCVELKTIKKKNDCSVLDRIFLNRVLPSGSIDDRKCSCIRGVYFNHCNFHFHIFIDDKII